MPGPNERVRQAQLEAVLTAWFHAGTFEDAFIEIATVPPRDLGPFCTSPAEAAGRAIRAGRERRNVYFGLNPRGTAQGSGKLGTGVDEDVKGLAGLVADLDCHGTKGSFKDKAAALAALRERLPAHLQPPILIDSGFGLWGLWPFRELLSVDRHEAYVDMGRRLVAHLGSDPSAYDKRRVARAVGTRNWRKPGAPVWASVVELDVSRHFDLLDFDDWLPRIPDPAARGTGASARSGILASEGVVAPKDLVPAARRVVELLGLRILPVTERSTGRLKCVRVVGPCPACGAMHEEKAWITPSGRLKCFRATCPAGLQESGSDAGGNPLGLELLEWVSRYRPEALSAIYDRSALATEPRLGAPRPSPTEIEAQMDRAFDEAVGWVREPQMTDEPAARYAFLGGPPGIGKSRKALRKIAQAGGRGTFLAPSHRLLDEKEDEGQALGLSRRRRYWGTLTRKDKAGNLSCQYVDRLKGFAESGWPIRSTACEGCPRKRDHDGNGAICPAFAGPRGKGTRFAVHQHAGVLGASDEIVEPVVTDELPGLLEIIVVPVVHLANLIGPAALLPQYPRTWMATREPLTRLLVQAARILLDEWTSAPKASQRFPRHVHGTELANCFRAAMRATGGPGQLDAFPHPTGGVGQTIEGLAASLAAAHAIEPVPPLPNGRSIREGEVLSENYPRRDLDEILGAIVAEATGERDHGRAACLLVSDEGVVVEYRRVRFERWRQKAGAPLSSVILDAGAAHMEPVIRAALPKAQLRFWDLKCPEDNAAVTRVHLVSSSATRASLVQRSKSEAPLGALTSRGARYLTRLIRTVMRRLANAEKAIDLAIVTHTPVARVIADCTRVLDGRDPDGMAAARVAACRGDAVLAELRSQRAERQLGRIEVMWYGNARGLNTVEHFDAIVLIGDPCPNIGECEEDARAIGIDVDLLIRCIMDAEIVQAMGRLRAVRRTPENPCTLIYVGRSGPAAWVGVPVETVPLAEGGPESSDLAIHARDVAADMTYALGAASPSLARYLHENTNLFARIGIRDTTAINNSVLSSSYVANSVEDLASVAKLNNRALQRAFEETLGHLPVVTTPCPRGPGRWSWHEARPRAAQATIDEIRRLLSAVASSTEMDAEHGVARESEASCAEVDSLCRVELGDPGAAPRQPPMAPELPPSDGRPSQTDDEPECGWPGTLPAWTSPEVRRVVALLRAEFGNVVVAVTGPGGASGA